MADIEAIVFDLDGTLVDTERLYRAAFRATCAVFGLSFPEALHARMVGLSRRERAPMLRAELGAAVPLEAFLSAYRARKQVMLSQGVPLKQGALALLRALRLRRVPCAVATSATRDTATELLRRSLLLPYLDAVVTRDDVDRGKPDPQTHRRAAARLDCAPSQCLALEDSLPGLAAATAAGMVPMLVCDACAPRPPVTCTYVVTDLADVPLPWLLV